MADIFLARATSEADVERHVVLKRVLASRSRDPHFAKMFLDEARLASQLHHPNIAQVHDIGKLAGSYFFTMEYVHGEDVRHIMQRLAALRRPMPINHALHVAAGTLAALHHAHERSGAGGQPLQIVHRDVSPSNVMVAYAGVVKLLDFGVAKASERTHESHAGTVKGKIAYLSPEQCEGLKVDRRSDIFSLGIVLYEMLTGKRLFRRDSDFASMLAIAKEDAPPPSKERPELSPEIDRIVLDALARHPDDRYPTAAHMLEAIEGVVSKEHHAMSAFAMGRFMKELFGERPEPWLELEAAEEHTQHITITSELFMLDDELSSAVLLEASRGPALSPAETDLEAQLDAAKPLFLAEEPDVVGPTPSARVRALERDSRRMKAMTPQQGSGRVAAPHVTPSSGTPRAPSEPRRAASQPPQTTPSRGMPVADAPVESATPHVPLPLRPRTPTPAPDATEPFAVPTSIETSPFTKQFEETPEVKPHTRMIIVIVACTIVAAVMAIVLQRSMHTSANAPATHADAAVLVMTSVDAAAAPPDAAPAGDATAVAPTIEAALATSRWTDALDLCAATKLHELAIDDRERCAIAACNARNRKLATMYRKVAAHKSTIDRTCKERGIVLTAPPPKEQQVEDPCEANPLKCR